MEIILPSQFVAEYNNSVDQNIKIMRMQGKDIPNNWEPQAYDKSIENKMYGSGSVIWHRSDVDPKTLSAYDKSLAFVSGVRFVGWDENGTHFNLNLTEANEVANWDFYNLRQIIDFFMTLGIENASNENTVFHQLKGLPFETYARDLGFGRRLVGIGYNADLVKLINEYHSVK